MKEIGIRLQEARQQKNISLAEASEATKIQEKYLTAMEEGNWEIIPGEVYLRGFLKSYADYLGVDSQELLADYKQQKAEETKKQIENDKPQKTSWTPALIVILVFLFSAAIILYLFFDLPF